MGQWYDVGLQAGMKVAAKVDEFIKREGFSPEGRKELWDGSVIYRWYLKWGLSGCDVGEKFKELLYSFDDQDEMDEDEYEATAYKVVEVGDEGDTDEYANNGGYEFFDDLFCSISVNYPEDFDEPKPVEEPKPAEGLTKERLLVIAQNTLGELIFGGDAENPAEMKQWCMKEFGLTEEEMTELGFGGTKA